MGSIGPPEIMVILVLAVILLGPDKLPEAVQWMAGMYKDVKKWRAMMQTEVRSVMKDVMDPMQSSLQPLVDEVRGTATSVTQGVRNTMSSAGASPSYVDGGFGADSAPVSSTPYSPAPFASPAPTAAPPTTSTVPSSVPFDPSLN